MSRWLIHVELVGAAGAGGFTSKLDSSLTSPVLQCSLISLSPQESLPPGPLHVAWTSHNMVVSEQSHFFIGGWFPRGERWELLGHLRATHGTSMASFPPSCIGQSSHRPVQTQRERKYMIPIDENRPIIN